MEDVVKKRGQGSKVLQEKQEQERVEEVDVVRG